MKTKYKFIHFDQLTDEYWICNNNRSKHALGTVEWYLPWKQWCFMPYSDTVFNDTCLADIQDFIGQLKRPRKAKS